MDEKQRVIYHCGPQAQHGPQKVVVQQIVGIAHEQKTIDVCITVPRRKPAIEQIIDVFVRDVCIRDVKVGCNQVVVCGDFEVKGIYVACLPQQPVHAVEAKHIRFSVPVCIPGAHYGMEADATVRVEFVDYDCDRRSRAYWYKEYEKQLKDNYFDHDNSCGHMHDPCDKPCHVPYNKKCSRKFNVTVVLCVTVKVVSPREIIINPWYTTLPAAIPIKPKG